MEVLQDTGGIMQLNAMIAGRSNLLRHVPGALFFGWLLLAPYVSPLTAQVSAVVSGTVTDQSGAVVSAATVTVKSTDTGAVRTTSTDDSGLYRVFALPVGAYEIRARKPGFTEEVRTGVRLVVGQSATVDLSLSVGEASQEVTVNADAPLVSVVTKDISGLVGERQIHDLPLNGRSYDQLLTLNPGAVNFTSAKTGGIGVSNPPTGTTSRFQAIGRSRICSC
jgi:carboxypeptidase family protein